MAKKIIYIVASVYLVLLIAGDALAFNRGAAESAIRNAENKNWSQAHNEAYRSGSPVIRKLVNWYYLRDPGNDASYAELSEFLRSSADWPFRTDLEARMEEAILRENRVAEASGWLSARAPKSATGKLLKGIAGYQSSSGGASSSNAEAIKLIREGWAGANFRPEIEQRIMTTYGNLLTQEDYAEKINTLLWERDINAANSLLGRVSADKANLFRARIALLGGGGNVDSLLSRVPSALMNDPGLLFDRIMYRERRSMDAGVQELLLKLGADGVKKPDMLWSIRLEHTDKLKRAGRYSDAYKVIANHALSEGERFARAEFMAGWIALKNLNDPSMAYRNFYKLHSGVKFPVSLSRAAYWAGLASEKAGQTDIANNWFKEAAKHSTTFYGQKASKRINGRVIVKLPANPSVSSSEYNSFKQKEVAQVATLLGQLDRISLAQVFMNEIGNNTKDAKTHQMLAMLGRDIGGALQVRSAKNSLKNHVVLPEMGYPVVRVSNTSGAELALVNAIIRQESEFDRFAVSPAGAMGLMQLMPGTARETAGKLGMPYDSSRLMQPEYNIRLGSSYISRMINNHNGSLLIALASYNAGPGRSLQWISQYGDPRTGAISDVDWIESIPFEETRNYVLRVMENTEVYRAVLGNAK